MWKVYNIQSGKIVKAGFKEEDLAKEWLEGRDHLDPEEYMVEEMDHDEEEEWIEANGEVEEEEEEGKTREGYQGDYGEDYYDGNDIDDDYMSSVYEDDEEGGDEEEEEEEAEPDDE